MPGDMILRDPPGTGTGDMTFGVVLVGGQPLVFMGGDWVSKPGKVYIGGVWVEKPWKRHNGSAWVLI